MRNFVIIGIIFFTAVSLTACVAPQPLHRSGEYLSFADGTHATMAAVRDNIRLLQKLDSEARQTSLALAFVRSPDKNNLQLAPPYFPEATIASMMEFLQALENYSDILVFGNFAPTTEASNQLSRLAQFLHDREHTAKVTTELQTAHAVLENAISDLRNHWRSPAMDDAPKDIVAILNGSETRLLLLSKSRELKSGETMPIHLYKPTLQHLQKRELRAQFLQNWQALGDLYDKMLLAHAVFAARQNNNRIMRDFLHAAVALQDSSENLVFAYARQSQ